MRLAAGTFRANVKLSGWRVLSRERLDLALIEAAGTAGARFLPGTQVGLGPEVPDRRMVTLSCGSEQIEVGACLIVAADGLGSRLLLNEPGAKIHAAPSSRVGAGAVPEAGPPFYEPGIIHMAYGTGGYVGLVRQEDGRLNIAAALDVDFLKKSHSPGRAVEQLLHETRWPAISHLADLSWQGTPTLTRQAARPAAARVFAVGDSSGYIEPFTGEGIGWAMASGISVVPLAVRAVREWQPALADEWTELAHRTKARSGQLCRTISWVSRRPLLARGLIGLVGRAPWLAGPLVNRIGAIPGEPSG
jgi:flavin-dependent dehydrogenase